MKDSGIWWVLGGLGVFVLYMAGRINKIQDGIVPLRSYGGTTSAIPPTGASVDPAANDTDTTPPLNAVPGTINNPIVATVAVPTVMGEQSYASLYPGQNPPQPQRYYRQHWALTSGVEAAAGGGYL